MNKFFHLDLNFENLKEYLMQMRHTMHNQSEHIRALEKEIFRRTTDVVMGKSLERISLGVSKKLGERPHAFKLDDPSFLQDESLDQEGKILKKGVEQVVEKMEILSKHCIN